MLWPARARVLLLLFAVAGSDANYHPIMCCHLWLISRVRRTAHLTASPAWEQPASISEVGSGTREILPQTSVSSYFYHSGMYRFRSSDADLGWLWAPPMNLSCIAIKMKANKERFWEKSEEKLSLIPVNWPVNSLARSDDGRPGTLQSFQ